LSSKGLGPFEHPVNVAPVSKPVNKKSRLDVSSLFIFKKLMIIAF